MKIVFVQLPKATRTYGPFPDAHAAAAALIYAESIGAEELRIQAPGEVHYRTYTIQQVRDLVRNDPDLRALSGMGNPEPGPGVINVGGRHYVLPTRGGLLPAHTRL